MSRFKILGLTDATRGPDDAVGGDSRGGPCSRSASRSEGDHRGTNNGEGDHEGVPPPWFERREEIRTGSGTAAECCAVRGRWLRRRSQSCPASPAPWFRVPSALNWLFTSVMLVGLLKCAVVFRALITTVFNALKMSARSSSRRLPPKRMARMIDRSMRLVPTAAQVVAARLHAARCRSLAHGRPRHRTAAYWSSEQPLPSSSARITRPFQSGDPVMFTGRPVLVGVAEVVGRPRARRQHTGNLPVARQRVEHGLPLLSGVPGMSHTALALIMCGRDRASSSAPRTAA